VLRRGQLDEHVWDAVGRADPDRRLPALYDKVVTVEQSDDEAAGVADQPLATALLR
jgi:hypothetical protein